MHLKKFDYLRFIAALLLIPFLASTVQARECELDFGMPERVAYKDRDYIVWPYQIANNTDKSITVPVALFLATDTGGRYHDRYQPEIEPLVEEGEEYENAFTMAGEFKPHQTKKALAYFENVDPNARVIYVYVTGLSHFFFWRWRLVNYSYRVVYRRSGDGWTLVEHGFSKDATHKDYEGQKDTGPQDGPSLGPILHAPDMRFQYKAPRGPANPRLDKMTEDFIGVWDAIFNAGMIRNPKKAIALWEAVTGRRGYREVDLQSPERVYTWEEAWERNKRLINQTHARMTGKPFEEPVKALWQNSKIDGYRELKDGVLEIYIRYARFYKKKYYYGEAVFKIRKTTPYRPIPDWRKYPYKSRWKIFDYRWKRITKPEYNHKVFAGYPKVKW